MPEHGDPINVIVETFEEALVCAMDPSVIPQAQGPRFTRRVMGALVLHSSMTVMSNADTLVQDPQAQGAFDIASHARSGGSTSHLHMHTGDEGQ